MDKNVLNEDLNKDLNEDLNKDLNKELTNNIIKNINNIYESINIYNAFFIIEPELLNDVYNKLKNNDYPVSTINDINKFIDNSSRILLINNTQINDIYNNIELINALHNVNVIMFIETPRIYDKYFYKSFFNIKSLNDKNINIFEL